MIPSHTGRWHRSGNTLVVDLEPLQPTRWSGGTSARSWHESAFGFVGDETQGEAAEAPGRRLAARCNELRVVVPRTYDELVPAIERWIATCVESRTLVAGRPIHRERALVRDNPSVRAVWEQIRDAAGQTMTIHADYTWSGGGVESIRFSAPVSSYTFPPEVVAVKTPDNVERILRRGLELLPASRLTQYQKDRIDCWLRLLLRPGADDRFITGQSILDYRNLTWQQGPSFSSARQWLLPEYDVQRRNVIGDDEVMRRIARVDDQIIQGRGQINREFAIQGGAVDVHTQKLREWVEGREGDTRSIYRCYYLQANDMAMPAR